jgi:hypothetical protein
LHGGATDHIEAAAVLDRFVAGTEQATFDVRGGAPGFPLPPTKCRRALAVAGVALAEHSIQGDDAK